MGEKTEKTENTGESEKVYFLVIQFLLEHGEEPIYQHLVEKI